MRRSFARALVVSLVMGLGVSTAFAERIGFVNLRRALRECTEGKVAQKKLGDEVTEKEKTLTEHRTALKTMGEALQKEEATLSKEDLEKRRQQIREKYFASEKLAAGFKAEVAKKESAVVGPLSEKLLVVVAAIAQREKLTHVLKAESVLWTESSAMDITNEVIRMANTDYEKNTKPAAEADKPAADKGAGGN